MSEHGMHIDDRGLTAKTEVPSAADVYLPAEFTRPNTKQSRGDEYAEMPGLEYLPHYDASILYLYDVKGKTEAEIARFAKVTQASISGTLTLARSAYSVVQSEHGLPLPIVRAACEELSIESLYRIPTSDLIAWLVMSGESPAWMVADPDHPHAPNPGAKTAEKRIRSALRRAVSSFRKSNKYKALGDLVAIHLDHIGVAAVLGPDRVCEAETEAPRSLDLDWSDYFQRPLPPQWIGPKPPTREELDEDDLASSPPYI